jgi:hypothetical protein
MQFDDVLGLVLAIAGLAYVRDAAPGEVLMEGFPS